MKPVTSPPTFAAGWRFRYLLREAAQNVFGSGLRNLLLVGTSLLLGTLNTAAYVVDSASFIAGIDELDSAGFGTIQLVPSIQNPNTDLSIDSCDRLTNLTEVERAGARNDLERVSVAQLGPSIPLVAMSGSLLTFDQRFRPSEFGVGNQIAPQFEGPLNIPNYGKSPARTLPNDSPPGFAVQSVVVVPMPNGTQSTKRCIVQTGLIKDPARIAVVASARLVATGPVAATLDLPLPFDPTTRYLTRPARFVPLFGCLAGAFLAVVHTRSRLTELASYLLVGSRRSEVLLILWLEQSSIVLLFGISSLASTWLMQSSMVSPSAFLVRTGFAAIVWLGLFGATATWLVARNLVRLVKDN